MKSCCVVGCSGPTTPNPILFEFPSSRLLRKRWLDAIKLPTADGSGSVCIRHFSRGDYTLVGGEARLRGRSVPCRRLGESDDEDSESSSEESDSAESTGSDRKKEKTDKRASKTTKSKDNGNASKNNEDNRETIQGNGEVIKDNRNVFKDNKEVKDNENADHNDNANNEKENNDIDIDKKDDESKISTEIQNTEVDHSCPENNNTDNCDNRLNNEKINDDNGIISNVNNENGKTKSHKEDVNNANGKINDGNENVNNDNGKINNGTEIVNNDKVKINNDNEIKDKKGKKTRCKITALRAVNGRKFSYSSDSSNSDSVSRSPNPSELAGHKEDIEEALQYYFIENKKTERQVAAMTDVINVDNEKSLDVNQKEGLTKQSEPVFIELSVGQGSSIEGQDQTEPDCLMVLENVQCEVDPALILAAREEDEENMEQVDLDDDDDDEPEAIDIKNADPISLLTSSDEDDVIIQEPKYDLVEVSSADTSEDDMPLVKLVKPSRKTSNSDVAKTLKYTKNLITKLIWGRNGFYCKQCGYSTMNGPEFNNHMATHDPGLPSQKIIQYCQDCGFTTPSKYQMQKHRQKHKNEKRFKCPKCNYSAKHSMSLVYHMRTHKNEVELAICGTFEPEKIKNKKGDKKSDDKKHKCSICGYKTNRKSDMKRHRRRVHYNGDEDDDDDEYLP